MSIASGSSKAEREAIVAYLRGRDDDCDRAWEAAHRAALEAGDLCEAARYAFWLALCLMLRGRMAPAGGWLQRARALLADVGGECAAAGYVLIPEMLGALDSGEPTMARDLAIEATGIAKRVGDTDLRALAVLAHGQALIALGDTTAGTARLDEVMVSVTAGEVGTITAGIVYCAVVLECMALFDLPRASEWTDALSAWCDRQSGLVPYRGQCLVHRSQLEQAAGRWPAAVALVEDACARLSEPPHPALGLAHYQRAELHRLLGDFERAQAEYRQASRHGHDPMPGLALLELARGDTDAAATAMKRALHETKSAARRPALLAAAVDTLLAAGDGPGARDAANELAALPSTSTVLTAMAARAVGAVLIDEGDAASALVALRDSGRVWQSLHLPYDAARTRELLAQALDMLGDRAAAELEFANARDTYAELGAQPDLARLDAGIDRPATRVLSDREREVLAHLAAGRTNREIADALVLSPHTVRRHVENIFAKLGVTTRAAATAYAYEHHLL